MTDWKVEYKNVIDGMWKEKRSGVGLTVIYPTCGGGSRSFCECARKRFYESITLEDVQRYTIEAKNKLQMEDDIKDVVVYGAYYNPANKHYGGASVTVTCDRCKKVIDGACIGYKELDLCLKCTDTLTEKPFKYYS